MDESRNTCAKIRPENLFLSLKTHSSQKKTVVEKKLGKMPVLQASYLAVIRPISGCVRIACSGLMITSLLQVVKRLDAS